MTTEPPPAPDVVNGTLREERWALLERLTKALEPVMVALAAVWIALLVLDLLNSGLPRSLSVLVWAIWIVFGLDFFARLLIAPARIAFLRRNWLTALSLALPAFRIFRLAAAFRFLRAARVARSVGLLRVITSLNRGLAAIGRTAQRRGVGYLMAVTALVLVVGAAAMTYFEASDASGASSGATTVFDDYGDALWWTANTMTTGPVEQPRTPEGRLFGWLLSVYGLGVFGYLTATLASHFIGADQARSQTK
jgi:voltage-gated potassium channel